MQKRSSCSSYLQKIPGGQPGDLPPPAWQQLAEHAANLTSVSLQMLSKKCQ
jgi:hypothetical protein